MTAPPVVPLLTVAEAAALLRIGRSLAYQLAGEYIGSGGVSGLRAVRPGSCLRVPRWALLELALTGRVVRLGDAQVADIADATVAGAPWRILPVMARTTPPRGRSPSDVPI